MQRKRLDRDIWTRITSKRYIQQIRNDKAFEGIVSLLYIDRVSTASIWEYPDEKIAVCDGGMKWLQIMPVNENYVITAMLNNENSINIWYIDIIANQGMSEDGVAFFDDLYLDLIIRPNGDVKIDDMDELDEALSQKDITEEEYNLALSTKEKLLEGIVSDISNLNSFCMELLENILSEHLL